MARGYRGRQAIRCKSSGAGADVTGRRQAIIPPNRSFPMSASARAHTVPTQSPQVRRQQILSELVRVNHQIAQVQKEMAHLEARLTAVTPSQRRAA